jgi:membrane fusion protein (multidrug efflux system)
MALVDLDHLYVVANYKETEMERIRPGQNVTMTIDSFPGKEFKGKVDSIMAGTGVSFSLFPAENATGNYVKVVQRIPIKIVFSEGTDKDHLFRIGMSVEPTVITK